MKKEELKSANAAPLEQWKCFVCSEEKEEMELFGEGNDRIYLICDSCHAENLRKLLANETLEGL